MEERKETLGTNAQPEHSRESDDALNMEESLAYAPVGDARPGEILQGRVVHISNDGVLVDVGAKSEGIVHLRDLSHRRIDRPEEVVKLGDQISVYVIGYEGEEGVLKLSKRRADEQVAWERLEEALKTGDVLNSQVVEVVKGGLVVDVGLRGFIPASLIAQGYVNDLAPFLGQTVRVKVVELDRGKRRAILSRKQVVEEEGRAKQEEVWAKVGEGSVQEGTVKSLTDFGAFIDLGGVDGLLHISEMSWSRIQHPSELLEVGQTLRVKVLRMDRERGKISLGLRQVTGNPWDTVGERFVPGRIYAGRVVRLASFGVFVELEPGVDGLVHISQLAEFRVNQPGDVVSVGDQVAVKVLAVEPERKRISLSKREADAEGGFDAIMPEQAPTDDRDAEADAQGRMSAYHAGDWDDEEFPS
ncbi:MAG: 30S ribosomal protein S1 [Thermaerobacter sp.]|nr:30S ribosomal protein S1 [Thermaerobacter sp.]